MDKTGFGRGSVGIPPMGEQELRALEENCLLVSTNFTFDNNILFEKGGYKFPNNGFFWTIGVCLLIFQRNWHLGGNLCLPTSHMNFKDYRWFQKTWTHWKSPNGWHHCQHIPESSDVLAPWTLIEPYVQKKLAEGAKPHRRQWRKTGKPGVRLRKDHVINRDVHAICPSLETRDENFCGQEFLLALLFFCGLKACPLFQKGEQPLAGVVWLVIKQWITRSPPIYSLGRPVQPINLSKPIAFCFKKCHRWDCALDYLNHPPPFKLDPPYPPPGQPWDFPKMPQKPSGTFDTHKNVPVRAPKGQMMGVTRKPLKKKAHIQSSNCFAVVKKKSVK